MECFPKLSLDALTFGRQGITFAGAPLLAALVIRFVKPANHPGSCLRNAVL